LLDPEMSFITPPVATFSASFLRFAFFSMTKEKIKSTVQTFLAPGQRLFLGSGGGIRGSDTILLSYKQFWVVIISYLKLWRALLIQTTLPASFKNIS